MEYYTEKTIPKKCQVYINKFTNKLKCGSAEQSIKWEERSEQRRVRGEGIKSWGEISGEVVVGRKYLNSSSNLLSKRTEEIRRI